MFFLTWRQLISRKKQTFLILLGISFGTMLFISISGVQLGLRSYISNQLLNNTAHILISGSDRNVDSKDITERFYGDQVVRWIQEPLGKRGEVRLENYQGWAEKLQQDPEVYDFSPRISVNALLSSGSFSVPVNLIGTLPERHVKITSIQNYMREGDFLNLKGGAQKIVLGSGVAKDLGVRPGQVIHVNIGEGESQGFKIVGIVHFGNDQIDKSIAFAELTKVQLLNHSPGRVSQIAVSLVEMDKSSEIADEWEVLGKDKVQDWQEANKAFMEMIRMQDFVRYFITTAILIVAAFGIYNVLSIMINQKQKEIAILRAIGYGPRKILELVIYQGVILGIFGGILGVLLGFFMCQWVESIDLNIEIGGSNHLIVSYEPHIYLIAFSAAFLASILASYFPAHFASRLSPMDIIRSQL